MPAMKSVSFPQASPTELRSIEALRAWEKTAMGMTFPESEFRQTRTIGERRERRRIPRAGVRSGDLYGVKKPDYARMRIRALSIQSMPPPSVAEGRASKTFNPAMFPGASDSALNELFTAIRNVTRAKRPRSRKGSRVRGTSIWSVPATTIS